MMITELVSIEKRIKVSIDDKFAFWVWKRDFKRYADLEKIQLGQEIEETLLDNIYEKIIFPYAKEAALALLERKDRSELEIRKKLEEKEFPEEIFDKVIAYLYEYHYLDEQRLVRSYLSGNAKNKSKRMILLKLKEKGISQKIIENVMEFEEYEGNTAALYALEKKLKRKEVESLSWNEKQKINASLYRKGFTRDEIYNAWKLWEETN